jgi:hypothetical protein
MQKCLKRACCGVVILGLAGCSGMTTLERVGTGAAVGGVAAAVLGANLGWGITAGVAGGLLSRAIQ